MTSIAKLKDRARKHEQKEDWKAAIEAYQMVLEQEEKQDEIELELGLFNRIGDLYLRINQTDQAVSYYEKAADKYAEAGFFNNAIALCNKALRHRPGRSQIILKLSRLCADQGFVIDARRWILEYAEREVKAGRVDAALDGLSDFVDNSADPDVREFLAEQLESHGRPDEAAEHYAKTYGERLAAGDQKAADRAARRARAIDPDIDLEAPAAAAAAVSTALPGLDDEPSPPGIEMREEIEDDTAAVADEAAEGEEEPAGALPGLETRADATLESEVEVEGLEGLESSGGASVVEDEEPEPAEDDVAGLEVSYAEAGPAVDPAEVEEEAATLGGLETFGDLEVDQADEEAGVGPGAEDDEGEPLPLMEEEAEPLPLLSTESYPEEEEPDLVVAEEEDEDLLVAEEELEEEDLLVVAEASEPLAAEEEEADLLEAEEEEADLLEAEEEESDLLEAQAEESEPFPSLDLGDPTEGEALGPGGSASAAGEEPAGEELGGGMDLGELDLDLGGFGDPASVEGAGGVTGWDQGGEEALEGEVPGVDAEAVLDRSRELVNRALWSEALAELALLEAEDPGPEVLGPALTVVKEIARLQPDDVAALRRRVEYASRLGDDGELVAGYLDLGDALARAGAPSKARVMYERVLEREPDNAAARDALDILAGGAPAGEDADPEFVAMLSQFKARVTESSSPEDAGAHYDLGLAFKEMGLVDEAIAEFQTALTGGEERLKVYEELGQCFILKNEYDVALKIFNRALQVPHEDPVELLGVYYHLGQCHEALGQRGEAREAYARVLAIDPSFQDVPDRMARL